MTNATGHGPDHAGHDHDHAGHGDDRRARRATSTGTVKGTTKSTGRSAASVGDSGTGTAMVTGITTPQ
ncbi:MAG: hypothetical protein IPP00_05560 [Actinomycetales bacterium]|uniref:Uncharacterized protein n=1 Tax=Candidatus Phosphoribacter hodrii TaxID=2953743 RepID=A0A9D7TBP1_9MICO|nr:hypothetical protein [Candidatus Phosphoribacter hodrii]